MTPWGNRLIIYSFSSFRNTRTRHGLELESRPFKMVYFTTSETGRSLGPVSVGVVYVGKGHLSRPHGPSKPPPRTFSSSSLPVFTTMVTLSRYGTVYQTSDCPFRPPVTKDGSHIFRPHLNRLCLTLSVKVY